MRSRHRSRRWSLEIFIGMPRAPGGPKRSHEIHLLLHLYDTNSLFGPFAEVWLCIANCRSEQSCQFLGELLSFALSIFCEKRYKNECLNKQIIYVLNGLMVLGRNVIIEQIKHQI